MIKMGVYGLLRTLTFLGSAPTSWAIAVLALGGASAIAGVLLALAQDDLKRLLAYSSVENVGIITLGVGVGLFGQATGSAAFAIAGFAGALLHSLNHGLFKGLLFQSAGVVVHETHSRNVEMQGGLLRRMPVTGTLFFLGALAIAGLPPLNGFISEWLIYLAALREGISTTAHGLSMIALGVVPLLALVGGLAVACFARAFGIVFLGEPRSMQSADAHDAGGLMRLAMLLGAAGCLAIGVLPSLALGLVTRPASLLAGQAQLAAKSERSIAILPSSLSTVALASAILLNCTLLLAIVRHLLLRRRDMRVSSTWDCGYAAPTSRMQYTAASFAAPVLEPFLPLFHVRSRRSHIEGVFAETATDQADLEDRGEVVVRRALDLAVAPLIRLRALQRGPVQLYLLYMLVTLIALLIWQVRP
jgi:formate hydrogenlyase subunit 3/multisubunit Na+/H+ antiporter MnhD subunit